ncbi:MAG: WYL domain-containing protein [Rectinemataceae bacterium]
MFLMAKYAPILRYKLILEKLHGNRRSSGKEMLKYLESSGYKISPRAFLRDIDALGSDYHVNVLYERSGNYYYIDPSTSYGLQKTISFLELAAEANIIIESFRDVKALQKYVVFDHSGAAKGLEHLAPLLSALKCRQLVRFEHRTYQEGENRTYTAAPQLLKQYQGRWYLIVVVEWASNPMVFGLDRISNLEVLPDQTTERTLEPSLFNKIVGVTLSEGPVEDVRIRATTLQAQYLEALPLHNSQRVVRKANGFVEFSLAVAVNFELIQELLRLGDTVQVLAPDSLVQEIRDILQKSLNSYRTLT